MKKQKYITTERTRRILIKTPIAEYETTKTEKQKKKQKKSYRTGD